jgi:uncharacterized protein YbjT (DUF2867 family)
MRVLLFGATGMVGSGVLLECLADPAIQSVLAVGRSASGRTHPKLRELQHSDFRNVEPLRSQFGGLDACFFCLGVSSLGMDEATYTRLTYDLTLAVATLLVAVGPKLTFCYVSGVGTDSSERGRVMWARVKGRTENALLGLGFQAAYMFRPGFIRPVKGARSKTGWIQALYTGLSPVISLAAALASGRMVTTALVGQAMIQVVQAGYPKAILEPPDIIQAARSHTLTTESGWPASAGSLRGALAYFRLSRSCPLPQPTPLRPWPWGPPSIAQDPGPPLGR